MESAIAKKSPQRRRVPATKSSRTPPGSRNVHMYWPTPLGARIEEVATLRGMTMTEIVVRVLQHADARKLLEQWINTPGPPIGGDVPQEAAG
jgi:hypothetical protein